MIAKLSLKMKEIILSHNDQLFFEIVYATLSAPPASILQQIKPQKAILSA